MPTTPKQDQKSTLKGCLGILIMIAGALGLIYFLPQLGRGVIALDPIDRLTIALSFVILAAARRK
jgi:hypothetical protein